MDLEKTLIGSDHSAQYGWRHVKRPGLDQLLERLSSYYEIVIFSENEVKALIEIIENAAEKEDEIYNPEFVKMILDADKRGNYTTIDPNNLWESLGLK